MYPETTADDDLDRDLFRLCLHLRWIELSLLLGLLESRVTPISIEVGPDVAVQKVLNEITLASRRGWVWA